ncbi:MAG: hypothetical protein JW795_15415 [Chitinivibrionales bacterium]|nr:hypothetical protein [Chitinivibrionales bacterium]
MPEKKDSLDSKFEERLKKNPHSLLFSQVADSYRKKGNIDQAIALSVKGLQEHPRYITGRIILGRCYLEQEKFTEATKEFLTICQLDRKNQMAIKMLADIFSKQGSIEKAGNLYSMLAKMDPDNPSFLHLATVFKGDASIGELFSVLNLTPYSQEPSEAVGVGSDSNPPESAASRQQESGFVDSSSNGLPVGDGDLHDILDTILNNNTDDNLQQPAMSADATEATVEVTHSFDSNTVAGNSQQSAELFTTESGIDETSPIASSKEETLETAEVSFETDDATLRSSLKAQEPLQDSSLPDLSTPDLEPVFNPEIESAAAVDEDQEAIPAADDVGRRLDSLFGQNQEQTDDESISVASSGTMQSPENLAGGMPIETDEVSQRVAALFSSQESSQGTLLPTDEEKEEEADDFQLSLDNIRLDEELTQQMSTAPSQDQTEGEHTETESLDNVVFASAIDTTEPDYQQAIAELANALDTSTESTIAQDSIPQGVDIIEKVDALQHPASSGGNEVVDHDPSGLQLPEQESAEGLGEATTFLNRDALQKSMEKQAIPHLGEEIRSEEVALSDNDSQEAVLSGDEIVSRLDEIFSNPPVPPPISDEERSDQTAAGDTQDESTINGEATTYIEDGSAAPRTDISKVSNLRDFKPTTAPSGSSNLFESETEDTTPLTGDDVLSRLNELFVGVDNSGASNLAGAGISDSDIEQAQQLLDEAEVQKSLADSILQDAALDIGSTQDDTSLTKDSVPLQTIQNETPSPASSLPDGMDSQFDAELQNCEFAFPTEMLDTEAVIGAVASEGVTEDEQDDEMVDTFNEIDDLGTIEEDTKGDVAATLEQRNGNKGASTESEGDDVEEQPTQLPSAEIDSQIEVSAAAADDGMKESPEKQKQLFPFSMEKIPDEEMVVGEADTGFYTETGRTIAPEEKTVESQKKRKKHRRMPIEISKNSPSVDELVTHGDVLQSSSQSISNKVLSDESSDETLGVDFYTESGTLASEVDSETADRVPIPALSLSAKHARQPLIQPQYMSDEPQPSVQREHEMPPVPIFINVVDYPVGADTLQEVIELIPDDILSEIDEAGKSDSASDASESENKKETRSRVRIEKGTEQKGRQTPRPMKAPAQPDKDRSPEAQPAVEPSVDFQAAAAAIPEHVMTPTLARIYYQQGQAQIALYIYRKLLQRAPSDARIITSITEVEQFLKEQKAASDADASAETVSPQEMGERDVKKSIKRKKITQKSGAKTEGLPQNSADDQTQQFDAEQLKIPEAKPVHLNPSVDTPFEEKKEKKSKSKPPKPSIPDRTLSEGIGGVQ